MKLRSLPPCFPPAVTVDADRFQGEDDPYPDHWEVPPGRWLGGPVELTDLPGLWRHVVLMRDVQGQSAAAVESATGLTADQQRAILNKAREILREHQAER